MNKHFVLFILLYIAATVCTGQIIFSEVMYDVPGSDYHDEFVEIFNTSADDTVDLTGWRFSDGTSDDHLSDAGFGLKIAPQQFGVILDGSYFSASGRYDDVIPPQALVLTISDKAFGSNGLSNSVAERLALLDSSGHEVQAYTYSVGNIPGYSDEKIFMTANNDSANWADALVYGGTPGKRNSVTPYDYDVAFAAGALSWHPDIFIETLQQVHLQCTLYNAGLHLFSDTVRVRLFVDARHDSLRQSDEILLLDEQLTAALDVGAQTTVQTDWLPQNAGVFWLTAVLRSAADENPFNNIISKKIRVCESRRTLHINEIKFLTQKGEPEWIELYNDGAENIGLMDWSLCDEKDTVRIDSTVVLHPGQFKVLTHSSAIHDWYEIADSLLLVLPHLPTLNNDSDVLYLLTPAGGWLEQVPYTKDWLEGEDWRYPSLERINTALDSRLPQNWGPSVNARGATPGRANSIFAPLGNRALSLQISPNPFSPDGDGREDHTVIELKQALNAARARVEIYDISGRKVRTLLNDRFTGATLSLVWDGRDDHNQVLRMGIYIVFIQLLNDRQGIVKEYKDTVVLAHPL